MPVYLTWLFTALVWAQAAPKSLPEWLTPYPGAAVRVSSTANMLNAAYTANAKADDVIRHYRTIFAAAGVAFRANADGMGTSVRATTPECELLITLREQSSGTQVQISCAAVSAPAAARDVRPENRPVYNATSLSLTWPSWLVHLGDSRQPQPVERKAYGESYLESRYQSGAPMVDLHQAYMDLIEANAFTVIRSHITTAQVTKGNLVSPKPYGSIEACRQEGVRANGPRTCVKALFTGNLQNGPVTVTLQVMLKGGSRQP